MDVLLSLDQGDFQVTLSFTVELDDNDQNKIWFRNIEHSLDVESMQSVRRISLRQGRLELHSGIPSFGSTVFCQGSTGVQAMQYRIHVRTNRGRGGTFLSKKGRSSMIILIQ